MYLLKPKNKVTRITFSQNGITDDKRSLSLYDADEKGVRGLMDSIYADLMPKKKDKRVKVKIQILEYPNDTSATPKQTKKEWSMYLYGCDVNVIDRIVNHFDGGMPYVTNF